MGKRIGLEIIAEILSLCRQPQTKTRVMYQTNLSWQVAQKYLYKMQSLELLEVQHSETRYVITQKGLKFLEKWGKLTQLL